VIPGNDEAIRSIRLITSAIADAILEGAQASDTQKVGAGHRFEAGEESLQPSPADDGMAASFTEAEEESDELG
jgi:small subunit ribosomal protein S2